jgi:hypothetical protein
METDTPEILLQGNLASYSKRDSRPTDEFPAFHRQTKTRQKQLIAYQCTTNRVKPSQAKSNQNVFAPTPKSGITANTLITNYKSICYTTTTPPNTLFTS